jgi:hypothetical protein
MANEKPAEATARQDGYTLSFPSLLKSDKASVTLMLFALYDRLTIESYGV